MSFEPGVEERRSKRWWQWWWRNDELTCVRLDKSDKSSWSAGSWWSTLGSWLQRQGDAWRKERLLTFGEENEGGRERATTSSYDSRKYCVFVNCPCTIPVAHSQVRRYFVTAIQPECGKQSSASWSVDTTPQCV